MGRRVLVWLLELAVLSTVVAGVLYVLHHRERATIEQVTESAVEAKLAYLRGYFAGAQTTAIDPVTAASPISTIPLEPAQTYLLVRPEQPPVVHPGGDPALADDPALVPGPPTSPASTPRADLERVQTRQGPAYVGSLTIFVVGQGEIAAHLIVQPFGAELAALTDRTTDHALLAGSLLLVMWLLRAIPLVNDYRTTRSDRRGDARADDRVSGADPPDYTVDDTVAHPSPIRNPSDSSARRPLATVVIEGFSSRLAFGILSFALPLYAYSLGMSLSAIGVLLATNMAVAVVLKPAMGAVIDRIGVRRAYIAAVVLRTLVILILILATGPVQLFIARGLHGVAIALRDPASATVLAALGGKKAVAQRFAWFQTVKTVAGSAGQFGAGILLTVLTGGFGATFLVAAVLSGIPLLIVLWGLRGPLVADLTLPQPPPRTPLPATLRRSLIPYAGLGAMMTGTAYLMANLLPVLAVEYMGLSPAAAGSLYLLKAGISFTGPAWGWLADRVSLRLVLGVRALGNALSSVVWLLVPTYAGLVAGKVADDVGKAAFAPAWGAVMAKVSDIDPPRRSRVLARMSAAEDAGEMAGPIIAGVVWTTFGLPALLILRAVLAVVTEVYAVVLGRRAGLDDAPEARPPAREPDTAVAQEDSVPTR